MKYVFILTALLCSLISYSQHPTTYEELQEYYTQNNTSREEIREKIRRPNEVLTEKLTEQDTVPDWKDNVLEYEAVWAVGVFTHRLQRHNFKDTLNYVLTWPEEYNTEFQLDLREMLLYTNNKAVRIRKAVIETTTDPNMVLITVETGIDDELTSYLLTIYNEVITQVSSWDTLFPPAGATLYK